MPEGLDLEKLIGDTLTHEGEALKKPTTYQVGAADISTLGDTSGTRIYKGGMIVRTPGDKVLFITEEKNPSAIVTALNTGNNGGGNIEGPTSVSAEVESLLKGVAAAILANHRTLEERSQRYPQREMLTGDIAIENLPASSRRIKDKEGGDSLLLNIETVSRRARVRLIELIEG